MGRYIYSSVTRISDLSIGDFQLHRLARDQWQTGDYIVGEVLDTCSKLHSIELANGRMMEVMEGDRVVGATGMRAATLEAVGCWQAMDGDTFEALTPAGLFGKTTSASPLLAPLMQLEYRGHACRGSQKVTMQSSLPKREPVDFQAPMVLIIGTSMSAGKTLSGRVMVHALAEMGLRVVGAKLTGAARFRDVLSFQDAGAVAVFDFVDAGLPSTVCSDQVYGNALSYLLAAIAALRPDVVVAEAGASPLEPYNGKTAMEALQAHIRFECLCAQDPYAVVGVKSAFARDPDLVAGGAANTSAGIDLVTKLTGLPALNLLDPRSHEQLAGMLRQALGL